MELSMTRREREDFLAAVHVGVLSIPEPGRRQRRRAGGVGGALRGRARRAPARARYLGREAGDADIAATAARREAEPNVLVRIRPERWLSVDYGKAFPSAGDVGSRLR
jgi:hypothetical protein